MKKAIQLSVLVHDMDKAKKFYVEKLGFVVKEDRKFTEDWRYLTVAIDASNETVIELTEAKTLKQKELVGKQAVDTALIIFETDDIKKNFRQMKQNGVALHGKINIVPGGRGIGFQDLYGNELDLFEPTIKS